MKRIMKKLRVYLIRSLAAFVYAVGISWFLDPNMLAPGGVSGIAIILNRFVGVETGTWILFLNIPILLMGAWKFGFRFMVSTIYCTVLSSFFINLLSVSGIGGKILNTPAITTDPLLAALAGGGLVALGIGIILRSGSTTGGMDIVVKLLRQKYPHLKTGSIMLALDALVVAMSALAFGDLDHALYAGISVGITSYVVDLVLYGRDGAKMIYIISDKADKIAERLLSELEVGVTFLEGSGAYSKTQKQVILCVMRKNLSPKAETVVKSEDAKAFMIVTNATEIYGEGYKNYCGPRM